MDRAWVAALGNSKGWLIALVLWGTVIGLAFAVPALLAPGRSRVQLNPQLAEVIRVRAELQAITGGMDQPGDAADDYRLAVQECIASNYYRDVIPDAALSRMTDPNELTIDGPNHVLAGATRREMRYTERFARPADWTSQNLPHYRAFDVIGRFSIRKADLLTKAGRQDEAEDLLKAVMVLGHRVAEERVRVYGLLTGIGLQRAAGNALLRIYQQAGQADKVQAVQAYLGALGRLKDQVDQKHSIMGRLVNQSPPTAELIWVAENDKDRMWRIEAALKLGLSQWAAPLAADQEAARQTLEALRQDSDPLVRQAADVALSISPEDDAKAR